MKETIFLLNSNSELVEMNEAAYLSEDLLQKLLADYPTLIPGSQLNIEKPRRWLLISREFGVADRKDGSQRWSLDHLYIDQEGVPTLVEVKRSTDTRIRREVVGQILDYAANAVSYWSIEEIKHRFEEECQLRSMNTEMTIQGFLQGELEIDSFWEAVKTNLKAGKIRMLIIADTIPKELQRIIEFLNEQMSPAEILGIEIKQFIGQNLKTLVPRVIGMTSTAQTVKGKSSHLQEHWTEERFFKDLNEQRGPQETAAARTIVDWVRPKVSYFYFGTGKRGSLAPILDTAKSKSIFSFALWTDGSIEIYFQHMKGRPTFDNEAKRKELLEKLNQITDVTIAMDRITSRPSFPISTLIKPNELNKFLATFEWYYKESAIKA